MKATQIERLVAGNGVPVSIYPWHLRDLPRGRVRLQTTEALLPPLAAVCDSMDIPHETEIFGSLRFIWAEDAKNLLPLFLVGGIMAVCEFLPDTDSPSLVKSFFRLG